jgi:hypothetical protein
MRTEGGRPDSFKVGAPICPLRPERQRHSLNGRRSENPLVRWKILKQCFFRQSYNACAYEQWHVVKGSTIAPHQGLFLHGYWTFGWTNEGTTRIQA